MKKSPAPPILGTGFVKGPFQYKFLRALALLVKQGLEIELGERKEQNNNNRQGCAAMNNVGIIGSTGHVQGISNLHGISTLSTQMGF